MEQRTDRRAHQPPENIEEGHVWKSEIRLVENKSLGWIEARRRAETVINSVPSAGWRIREIAVCASSPKTHPQIVRLPKTSRKWPSKTQHNRRFSAQKSTWQW